MTEASRKKNKNDYLLEMNEHDKEINNKIIQTMNKRINYLKNPRYTINKNPQLYSYINTKQDVVTNKDTITAFRLSPKQIIFRDYTLNSIYEIDLYVTNATKLLQRIRVIPPEKMEFQVATIKYPSREDGTIASGMSAILKIRFNPSSLAEFDDQICVLTEDHILKIPILARKEPPLLDLPTTLDCQSCWLGDEVETNFIVTNSGGEAGYRFFQEGVEPEQDSDNYVQIGNFYISPAEFYLQKGETQTIHALFRPNKEGEIRETIILGCDNQTQANLTLIGKGNMVELKISGIDNKDLEAEQEMLSKIFFNNPIPNVSTSRKLRVRNKTSVKVNYHWSLHNNNDLNLVEESCQFTISPPEGSFQPNEYIDFILSLKSAEYYPLFTQASLIIDEIPFESIRNPPPQLKAQFESNSDRVIIGTNSIKPSITYFEFELMSKSALATVHCTPAFYKFPLPVCVGTLQKYTFTISNKVIGNLKYKITPIFDKHMLDEYIDAVEGVLTDTKQIELGFTSCYVDQVSLGFKIDFDYADTILITMHAQVVAPLITISENWINYGLIQTYSLESKEIQITNISTVPLLLYVTALSDQRLVFNRDPIELLAKQSVPFKIDFNSKESETYHDFLSFQVDSGECTVLEVFAEVQTPSVSLNLLQLQIDTLYTGNTYTFDQRAQQYIMLQNLGNIATPFEWQLPQNTDKYIVQYEPRKGVLKPKTNQTIKFSIKPKQGGPLNDLFVCDVQGIQYPLGFEMNTTVYGLSVEYELVDDTPHISSKLSAASKSMKSMNDTRKSMLQTRKSMLKEGGEMPVIKGHSMDKLEFYNCTINQPKQAKFLIKNTSGIHTQFTLSMKKYQPHALDDQSIQFDDMDAKSIAATRTIKFGESSISKSVNKKGKITQGGRPVVLLTNKIERTQNFTSEAGQILNKQKKLQHDQRVYLSNNLGIAVVFEPSTGSLAAYGTAVVSITLFNDICGVFDDIMCCDIRGLPIKEFPVSIEIKGSPVVISPSQLGFSYKTDYPSYDLGTFMRNSGTISREFRVQNTGPQEVELDWKIYNLGQSNGQELFDIKITNPPLGSDQLCDVQFIANEPQESLDGPYTLAPQREKLRGRKEKHFTICFHPLQSGVYSACIVAKPRLTSSDQSIGEVAFYANAETITPSLYFDKLEQVGGGHLVKFQKWSSGFNKRQQKRIVLLNKQRSSLVCTVEVEGPFKLVKSSTNSPQKYELELKQNGIQRTFNLIQGSHMELEVLFDGYDPNDSTHWPLTYKVYNQGKLTVYFANGDSQVIQFEGVLLRPYVHLNTSGIDMLEGPDVLDFGIVSEEQRIAIYLSNVSSVPAAWKLQHQKNPLRKNIVDMTMTLLDKEEQQKTDDPSVFMFEQCEGMLQGPSTMVHTLPHATALPHQITLGDIQDLGVVPFKILICFKPKSELLYKSKYRIRVQDGPFVEFTLRGRGKNIKIKQI